MTCASLLFLFAWVIVQAGAISCMSCQGLHFTVPPTPLHGCLSCLVAKKNPSHIQSKITCVLTKIIKIFPIFVLSSTPMTEINNS